MQQARHVTAHLELLVLRMLAARGKSTLLRGRHPQVMVEQRGTLVGRDAVHWVIRHDLARVTPRAEVTLRVVVHRWLVARRAMQVLVAALLRLCRGAGPLLSHFITYVADALDCLRASCDRVGSSAHVQHAISMI